MRLTLHAQTLRHMLQPLTSALLVFALFFAPCMAQAEAWSLTKTQRQNYLKYYAPLILHRADENDGKSGRDWMSNFDFDRDSDFSNNRHHWLETPEYIAARGNPSSPYARWRIRPTVYSALIEYMDEQILGRDRKSLVLLYHIYYASDKNGSDIHDWERVEIHLHNVTGTPGGSGEYVNATIITDHKEHIVRTFSDLNKDMNFMQTSTGKHLMVWQADESGPVFGKHARELHYVQNAYSWIASQKASGNNKAKVDVNDDRDKARVHYVFVPETSSAAVRAWGARPLAYATAATQHSGVDNEKTVPWSRVPRITYELQDIADIHRSSSQLSAWWVHWNNNVSRNVLLESPIVNEMGGTDVPRGMHHFYLQSRDSYKSSQTDGRKVYIAKGWMWGDYSAERNPDHPAHRSDDFGGFADTGRDSRNWSRSQASGYTDSGNNYWWQHDYFVHSGEVNSKASREEGKWLVGSWYSEANGGFDGRWVQLFDDR